MEEKTLEQITQVRDLNIQDLVPTQIDGVTIEVVDNKRQIHLPISMNGERFLTWKKRRGGVFYKDLFFFLIGKDHGKYIEASGENILLVLRIIDDEELSLFQTKRLVYGKIKDQYVMLLKDLLKIEGEETDYEYTEEINLEEAEEENKDPEIPEALNIPLDEEESNSGRSLSLFD